MGAGQMRSRVTFRRESNTADGAGGNARTWTDVATVWGQLSPERGREKLQAGRLEEQQGAVLKVRSSSTMRSITTEHQCVIDSEQYQIRSSSNPDQRNRFIEFVVERGGIGQ